MVTLYTTGFNMKKLHVLPTQCMNVCWVDLRRNSHGFPTRHDWSFCLPEKECVYCAERNEFLNNLRANRSLSPRRPRFVSRSLPFVLGLWCTKCHQERIFSQHFCFFPSHYLFTTASHSSSWRAAVTRSTNRSGLGTLQKPMVLRELRNIGQKSTFTFFLRH